MGVTLSATMYVSNSSVVNGQTINGVVTCYNQGTTPTTVSSIQLTTGNALTNGGGDSVSLGSIPINGPGMNTALPAASGVAGQVSFPFSLCVFSGVQPNTTISQEFAFPIVANVATSDGSYVQSSTATVQCVPPQNLPYQSPGQFPFTPSSGPLASTTVLTPAVPGAIPSVPVQGQLRMDSNLNSGLSFVVI